MNKLRQQVKDRLNGVIVPVATPFRRDGKLDEGRFRDNLAKYASLNLAGVLVAGSTGEAPYLGEGERLRLVGIARRVIQPPQLVLAGTGRLSREAVARGADALLIITPAYYRARMDDAALTAHYRAVASQVANPILIYSIPQFTGVRLTARAVAEISRHPNIVGIKESSGDERYLRSLLRRVPSSFKVLVGSPSILVEALRCGAAGAVLAVAVFVPELCIAIYQAMREGNLKLARQLHRRLLGLVEKIIHPYGIAGIKAALDLAGYAGGPSRSPLLPLTSAARQQIAAAWREYCAALEF